MVKRSKRRLCQLPRLIRAVCVSLATACGIAATSFAQGLVPPTQVVSTNLNSAPRTNSGVARPVRLPAVGPAPLRSEPIVSHTLVETVQQPRAVEPWRLTAIADEQFKQFETLDALDIDLNLPKATPSVGGWVELGYARGSHAQ